MHAVLFNARTQVHPAYTWFSTYYPRSSEIQYKMAYMFNVRFRCKHQATFEKSGQIKITLNVTCNLRHKLYRRTLITQTSRSLFLI